jgi:hypothetical protein
LENALQGGGGGLLVLALVSGDTETWGLFFNALGSVGNSSVRSRKLFFSTTTGVLTGLSGVNAGTFLCGSVNGLAVLEDEDSIDVVAVLGILQAQVDRGDAVVTSCTTFLRDFSLVFNEVDEELLVVCCVGFKFTIGEMGGGMCFPTT